MVARDLIVVGFVEKLFDFLKEPVLLVEQFSPCKVSCLHSVLVRVEVVIEKLVRVCGVWDWIELFFIAGTEDFRLLEGSSYKHSSHSGR